MFGGGEMGKVYLREQLKHLYLPDAKAVQVVEVPEFQFIAMDGVVQPDRPVAETAEFQEALKTLYGISFTLKFMSKRMPSNPIDYTVMALEGLWWVESGGFDPNRKEPWYFTAMILQPEHISQDMYQRALEDMKKKCDAQTLQKLRFEPFHEGLCMQIMHVGPYADEPRTLDKLMSFATDNGYRISGKHHEIYLGDPRRSRPQNLKTVLRYPVEKIV
jgi:hypothetical protein